MDYQTMLDGITGMTKPEVLSALSELTNGKRSGWKRVFHPTGEGRGYIHDVAYLPDGSIQANGHDPETVARAILSAVLSDKVARSKAAQKAAATRAKRREKQLYRLVKHIRDGGQFVPSSTCRLCGKKVEDADSIARGIGPDCWQTVMRELEQLAA